MRISVKGRYALAAIITVAQESDRGVNVSVNSIAEQLGISKIYLEQVFAQLKKSELLNSVKGPRGGYKLTKSPVKTTVWEVLVSLEAGLPEQPEDTVSENAPDVEAAMLQMVFEPLDRAIRETLGGITIQDLVDSAAKNSPDQFYMMNM